MLVLVLALVPVPTAEQSCGVEHSSRCAAGREEDTGAKPMLFSLLVGEKARRISAAGNLHSGLVLPIT